MTKNQLKLHAFLSALLFYAALYPTDDEWNVWLKTAAEHLNSSYFYDTVDYLRNYEYQEGL